MLRFYKISNSSKKLNKVNFKENMGILGLDTAFLLSERVFQLMDEDQDGMVFIYIFTIFTKFRHLKISLADFINYMNVLLNGTIEMKNELSFKMIDYKRKGFFVKADLKELIESTITVWTHLTGNQLSKPFFHYF